MKETTIRKNTMEVFNNLLDGSATGEEKEEKLKILTGLDKERMFMRSDDGHSFSVDNIVGCYCDIKKIAERTTQVYKPFGIKPTRIEGVTSFAVSAYYLRVVTAKDETKDYVINVLLYHLGLISKRPNGLGYFIQNTNRNDRTYQGKSYPIELYYPWKRLQDYFYSDSHRNTNFWVNGW